MASGRARTIAIGLLYAAMSVYFCGRLFDSPYGLGIMDWDEKLFYYASVLKSALEYGQPPFWNPWHCGGDVLWANPQVELLSPTYLLAIAMPLAVAIKVNIVLHFWIALVGMHLLLTRLFELTFLPLVVYLASLFAFSGAPAMHIAVGHSVLLPMFYLPLLLFFLLRALQTGAIRDALLAGAVMAMMIINGGLHVVAMAVVAVGAVAIAAAIARRSWAPIVIAAALGISGVLYAAPKLVPVTMFVADARFQDTRSATVHPDRMTASMLLRAYLVPPDDRPREPEQQWGWYEYGNYIGWLAPILILGSVGWIAVNRRRSDWWLGVSLAATMVLLLAWSAGEFSALAPASLASHLPFFVNFRVPSRFAVVVGLFAAATAGWALKAMAFDPVRRLQPLVAIVCVLATLQLVTRNRGNFEGMFSLPPLDRGFQVLRGPRTLQTDRTTDPFARNSPMLRAMMSGVSFSNCYEPFQFARGEQADAPLVAAAGDARVSDIAFTPNRVDFSVVGGRSESRIVLNQNFGPGWTSTAGPVVMDASGRPSVALRGGETGRFSFSYRPPGLLPGYLILAAAFAISCFLWRRRIAG